MSLRLGRRLAGALACALLCALAGRAGSVDEPPASRIEGAAALAPFLSVLAALDARARTRPVQILVVGDSHSAADHIGSALRDRLQARFGEGGRGVLPPGRPFAAYNPRQVSVEQSDGWRLDGGLAASWVSGLTGWSLTSVRPDATVTVTAEREALFDRAAVCALTGPGAGFLTVAAGEERTALPLAATAPRPACRQVAFSGPKDRLQLRADGGPVTLLSIATWRERPGVVLSNLGIIGARMHELAARDDGVLAAELEAYAPDLIVLAFGSNEGFDPSLEPASYEALVKAQVRRFRRLAPAAAILLAGPPDVNAVRPDIPRDGVHNKGFDCAPLSPDELRQYDAMVEGRSRRLARWYPPPPLALAREAQRRAAAAEGAAFWDWGARMGGPCSAHLLRQQELVRGDHIHFTTEGGDMIGRLLFDDLMAAYAARAPAAAGS